jgi:hypothetical protein
MTESNYKGFYNFEAFWQSGKVFEGVSQWKSKAYWRSLKEPKRRYPGSKGKKVLFAQWDEGILDYVASRKKVYVPLYHEQMKDKEMALHWKEEVEKGIRIVVYDFDGPRLKNGSVTCVELTEELLIEKINDTSFPFGHGYVVAAFLAGISLDSFL